MPGFSAYREKDLLVEGELSLYRVLELGTRNVSRRIGVMVQGKWVSETEIKGRLEQIVLSFAA